MMTQVLPQSQYVFHLTLNLEEQALLIWVECMVQNLMKTFSIRMQLPKTSHVLFVELNWHQVLS
jgi:hypothetical protein